jgi:hypothetical protein
MVLRCNRTALRSRGGENEICGISGYLPLRTLRRGFALVQRVVLCNPEPNGKFGPGDEMVGARP